MLKPQEVCVVTALGLDYKIWETVEVTTATDGVIDHAMLTVSEPSRGASSLANLRLKPGDQASVTLAGQTVINGFVYLRQGACDANAHSVQIGICSKAQNVIPSTVRASPGQYSNQTLQQMVSAVFGEVGVKFSLQGSPDGADKPFDRISEHIGETRFAFADRLARMRNIHLVDDGNGGIVGFRGPWGNAASSIDEGRNMKRGCILLRNDESLESLTAVGQRAGQESAGDNSGSQAQASVSTSVTRDLKIACEEMADNKDCQLRINQEADWVKYQEVDGTCTVQGWLNDEDKLWWNDKLKLIVVNSPLLLPENSFGFVIKGIIHRQGSDEGTTTDILLCRADGLGATSGEPYGSGN
jgi:prophage tail gpP-like protein